MALTYQGSTAGSTLSNPPVLLAAAVGGHVQFATTGATGTTSAFPGLPNGGSGAKLWFYSSSNSFLPADTELYALNAINDGWALGMTIGDIIIGIKTTANSTSPILGMGILVTSAGATGFTISSNSFTSTQVS